MNKDVADKWVKALRSGEYTQSKYDLQNGAEYCCLGVLCDIGSKEGLSVGTTDNGNIVGTSLNSQKSIKDWSGMKTAEGLLPGGSYLTRLNDTDNYTFEQIADVIEKEWENL